MATAKKSRPKRKIATSKPVAAKTKVDEPEVEAKAKETAAFAPSPEPEPGPKVVEPKVVDAPKEVVETAEVAPEKAPAPRTKPRRTYIVHLVEGASCNFRGHHFVAGRPHVTSDGKLFEALRYNGRFRVDVREGGAQ